MQRLIGAFRLYKGNLSTEGHLGTFSEFGRANRVAHGLATDEGTAIYIVLSDQKEQKPLIWECDPKTGRTEMLDIEKPEANGNGERNLEL